MKVKVGDLVYFSESLYTEVSILGTVVEIFYEFNHGYNDEGDDVRYRVYWFDGEYSSECEKEIIFFRKSFLDSYGYLLKREQK